MHIRTGLTAGQKRPRRFLISATLLALPFFASGCKLENELLPSGPTGDSAINSESGTIGSAIVPGSFTPPIIANPLPGSTVSDAQPSLTVLNSVQGSKAQQVADTARASSARTYLFQVATDATFETLAAQSNQVPEGPIGVTSWTVDRPLGDGRYFWRVRARSGTTDSPFSSTAEFSVGEATAGAPPPETPPASDPNPPPAPRTGSIISDPLGGGSVGEVHGGRFSSAGWTVTSPGNFIRYEVPPLASGWVEFETTGLRETNPSNDQFMLFGMWDPTAGDFRANPFRVNIQKLHPNPHNPPYLRLRFITNGEQHDEGNMFYQWIPSQRYHWRLEWGPSGGGNRATVYLDGVEVISVNYNRAYRPNVHFIELGIGERGESVVGVTYSNFQVGN